MEKERQRERAKEGGMQSLQFSCYIPRELQKLTKLSKKTKYENKNTREREIERERERETEGDANPTVQLLESRNRPPKKEAENTYSVTLGDSRAEYGHTTGDLALVTSSPSSSLLSTAVLERYWRREDASSGRRGPRVTLCVLPAVLRFRRLLNSNN